MKRPTCSRCDLRNINCDYPSDQEEHIESLSLELEAGHISYSDQTDTVNILPRAVHSATPFQEPQPSLDASLFDSLFSSADTWESTQSKNLTLCPSNNISCSIDSRERTPVNNGSEASGIDNLQTLEEIMLPFSPQQSPAENVPLALTKHSMELIFRVLRTWPKMLAEEFQAPPLFHATQLTPGMKLPLPLATCITLTKMWNGTCEGAEDLVRKTILRELGNLVDRVCSTLFV